MGKKFNPVGNDVTWRNWRTHKHKHNPPTLPTIIC